MYMYMIYSMAIYIGMVHLTTNLLCVHRNVSMLTEKAIRNTCLWFVVGMCLAKLQSILKVWNCHFVHLQYIRREVSISWGF